MHHQQLLLQLLILLLLLLAVILLPLLPLVLLGPAHPPAPDTLSQYRTRTPDALSQYRTSQRSTSYPISASCHVCCASSVPDTAHHVYYARYLLRFFYVICYGIFYGICYADSAQGVGSDLRTSLPAAAAAASSSCSACSPHNEMLRLPEHTSARAKSWSSSSSLPPSLPPSLSFSPSASASASAPSASGILASFRMCDSFSSPFAKLRASFTASLKLCAEFDFFSAERFASKSRSAFGFTHFSSSWFRV
eukprot:3941943-Rhodomonas_salina.6